MNDIVNIAKIELENLNVLPNEGHLKTGDIRKISAKLFQSLQDKSKNNVFVICESLLQQRNWAMSVIAYDFAYRVRKQYDDNTFSIFESWLRKFVRGWGDCDDFCTHAFGELIIQNPTLFEKIIPWTQCEDFWMRRAAAVVLIPSINHNKYEEINPIVISDLLIEDKDDLVRKGYGWMLKVLSIKEPQLVYDYLVKYKDIMPRVSFRYALEKMDQVKKIELMRL